MERRGPQDWFSPLQLPTTAPARRGSHAGQAGLCCESLHCVFDDSRFHLDQEPGKIPMRCGKQEKDCEQMLTVPSPSAATQLTLQQPPSSPYREGRGRFLSRQPDLQRHPGAWEKELRGRDQSSFLLHLLPGTHRTNNHC